MSPPNSPPDIEGTWQMIRAELSGQAAPELVVEQMRLELRAGHYEVWFGAEVSDHGRFEIGATNAVRTLTLFGESGPNAGRYVPCIYQLVGDRLRVCFGLDETLPKAFTTVEGDARYLAVYRRKPVDSPAP